MLWPYILHFKGDKLTFSKLHFASACISHIVYFAYQMAQLHNEERSRKLQPEQLAQDMQLTDGITDNVALKFLYV